MKVKHFIVIICDGWLGKIEKKSRILIILAMTLTITMAKTMARCGDWITNAKYLLIPLFMSKF